MTPREVLKIARGVASVYWWEFRASLGFEQKVEHHNIDVSICYKGVELIGCDSDHLYYIAKLGGFADRGQGWVDLLHMLDGSVLTGGAVDPSLSLADLSIRIRPAGAGHKCDDSCFCFATLACGPECSYCTRVLSQLDVRDERKPR